MTRALKGVHRPHRTLTRCVVMVSFMDLVATAPGYAQIAVTSSTLVERIAVPGETYRDTVTIHNSSSSIQTVSLSLADYSFDADGSTQFDEPGSRPRSSAGWIQLSQRTVSVLPQSDVTVGYSVAVPSTAPLPVGSYWGVVLVEVDPSAAMPSDSAGLAVIPRLRYAVQLATHVGSTGQALLAFGEPLLPRGARFVDRGRAGPPHPAPDVSTPPSGGLLAVDVAHVGTRACRPILRVEVYGDAGTLAYRATAPRGLLYPGASLRQTFDLSSLASGDYTVLLLADVGGDVAQGTTLQVHIQ